MKRVIGVECWADYYFFGKLLKNESLLRKEKNKNEVLKGLLERNNGLFSIGVVDKDKCSLSTYFKNEVIETEVRINDFIEVAKLKNNCHFIIQLCPDEFENWLVDFINLNDSSINNFGYSNLEEFKKDSKSILEKLLRNERFLEALKFVLINTEKSENHIRVLKNIINYLIDKNYDADINELKNL